MNNAGKLALLGALGLAVAGTSTKNRSANVPALAAPTNTAPTIDANTLYDLFISNPDLQKLLKGQKGDKGDTGAQGNQGDTGNYNLNFGGSLIVNSAGELGNVSNWGAGVALAEVFEGMQSLAFTHAAAGNILNTTVANIDNRRLYKLTCFAKTTASNAQFFLQRLDQSGNIIIQASSNFISPTGAVFNNAEFAQKTLYFGGISNNATSFGLAAAKTKLSCYAYSAGVTTVNKLKLTLVDLGEPVPYNLPYLPTGQMVVDNTTGEVGFYNGTSVVWFAA